MKNEMAAQVAEMGLSHVSFEGYVTGSRLTELVERADFLVLPSEWYENCPYSVMEALAMAKPVVAARIGGLPELIRDGETGVLFEPGNAEDLAVKICTIADNSAQRWGMGKEARIFAKLEFDAESYYREIVGVYGRLFS